MTKEENDKLSELFRNAEVLETDMFSDLSRWQKFNASTRGRIWVYWRKFKRRIKRL